MFLQRHLNLFIASALGLVCGACFAETKYDAAGWLQRIVSSAQSLPYTGIYVHQTTEQTTSSRVTHMVDGAGVEHEKIETLDGPPQEIIRRNEEMFLYQPFTKTIQVDRRTTGRFFPSLVSGNPKALAENYQVKLGSVERIGGHECQWVLLEPKDNMRYPQQLCADVATGLLLRAAMFNNRRQLVEQFSFTQLEIGGGVREQAVRSRYENLPGWQMNYAAKPDALKAESDWQIINLPAGFHKIAQVSRTLAGRTQPVSQIVYSDGLAFISIFVEQIPGAALVSMQSDSSGSTTYAIRPVLDYQITVLGEVPVSAVQTIADGVSRQERPAR